MRVAGKVVGASIVMAAAQLQTSPDSVHRRAALISVLRLCEGCTSMIAKSANELEKCVDFMMAGLQDASPWVQYQGLQGVGRFAVLFPSRIHNLLAKSLPVLITCLATAETGACQKVKGHAASALINLLNPSNINCNDSSDPAFNTLTSNLNPLMSSLVHCLQTASLEVQSPCLVVLG